MKRSVLGSVDELDEYREAWEALRLECKAPIFVSYDLVRLWLDNYRGVVTPQIVVVEDKGELVGLAPFCTYKHTATGVPVRTLTMTGNGKNIIGYSLLSIMAKDHEIEVVRELVRGVKEARWNLMQLFDLEPDITMLRFLDLAHQELDWQPYQETNNIFYEFPPEGDVASRFGKHTRKLLRSTRRILEREGRLRFRALRTVDEAEAAMRLYVEQHIERWETKGGSTFREERNARQLVEMGKLAMANGSGVIYELLIDGKVAGQQFSFLDGEVVRGYRIGMSDEFKEHSPGKLVVMLSMEDLRARGFKGFDLLRGNEDYKHHMMTRERVLPAIQAQRGSLKLMSRVRNLPPVRMLDERLRLRERMLKKVYRG